MIYSQWFHENSNSKPTSTRLTTSATECAPVERVYFLKIQKAGSTSIANVLYHFGVTRNLDTLTLSEHGYRHPTKDFKKYAYLNRPDDKFDIFCEHSIFDAEPLNEIMKSGYKRIAIVREPLSQLRSYIKYFAYDVKLGLEKELDPAQTLLHKVDKYQDLVIIHNTTKYRKLPAHATMNNLKKYIKLETLTAPRGVNMTFSWNWVAEQFGYDYTKPVEELLRYINSQFHVVLILEKLDESLVLMKQKFCWRMKDILNMHLRKTEHVRESPNDTFLRKIHYRFSRADYAIYDHFLRRLHQKIAHEKSDFADEVRFFQNISTVTHTFCRKVCRNLGQVVRTNGNQTHMVKYLQMAHIFEASSWESAFNVSGVDCIMMMFKPSIYRHAILAQMPLRCKDQHLDTWCGAEHFAYNFPWDVLYQRKGTFLSECY